ncbi:MAG: PucR family transcriptional regulator [Pseudonocardiaceae bacterium]|nr:PucR family transcriptional regulator [Pseudonocardiaceae bacterium]
MSRADVQREIPTVATVRSPTIAQLLELPVLARGLPQVVSGESNLDRKVRWVHATEWANPAATLRGGELILTTGIGFPDSLDGYAAELADVNAAGLVLELGRRYREVPQELQRACRVRDVPLIVLHRGVKFVDVTHEVHTVIHSNQLRSLRDAQRIHDTFTALSLRGAEADEVVQAAATMTGRAVVLENLVHQAVICRPAHRTFEDVLNLWERRSRATSSPVERTDVAGPEGWLVTSVELRGQRWGRLMMLPGSTEEREFHAEHIMVLERAAIALTLARLTHDANWERQAHRTALRDVVEQRYGSTSDARARVEALGVPTRGRKLIIALVRTGVGDQDGLAERLGESLTATPALVGDFGDGQLVVLLAVKESDSWRPSVRRISELVHANGYPEATVSVGSEVSELFQLAQSFRQAEQVADAIPPGTGGKSFHEHADVGLPELLYALRDDLRVQEFAERQLAPLLDYDARHGADLLGSLRHYLCAAGNKSIAAKRDHLSRQAFYQRLRVIEQVLGCDLESGEQRAQLHVAITALDAHRLGRPAP